MMTTTRHLTERSERENNNKYVSHEIVGRMYNNNKDFYDDVVCENFNIRLFGQSFKKRMWQPRQVVGFLAFGRILDAGVVIDLLGKYCPNWRAQFFWLVFLEHMKNF